MPVLAQSQTPTGCHQVLPNGQTVGNVVGQSRTQLQASYDNAAQTFDVDPALSVLGTFAAIASPRGPIDFKNNFSGSGSPSSLSGAGNFSYYAIGTGYLPDTVLDAGASAYSILAILFSNKNPSTVGNGPLLIDDSAASVRNAALASGGCP
jgi:hypothetical protein